MYILDELFAGRVCPTERKIKEGGEYERLNHLAVEQQDLFYSKMCPEDKKAYNAFTQTETELNRITDCDMFIKGFRCGARVILDVIGQYDSELPQMDL